MGWQQETETDSETLIELMEGKLVLLQESLDRSRGLRWTITEEERKITGRGMITLSLSYKSSKGGTSPRSLAMFEGLRVKEASCRMADG